MEIRTVDGVMTRQLWEAIPRLVLAMRYPISRRWVSPRRGRASILVLVRWASLGLRPFDIRECCDALLDA
jgi:hypothetical protein